MVRRGPVSLQYLLSSFGHNLNAECLVWRKGMKGWTPLREVPEVFFPCRILQDAASIYFDNAELSQAACDLPELTRCRTLQVFHNVRGSVERASNVTPHIAPALPASIHAASTTTRVLVKMPDSLHGEREPRCQICVQKHDPSDVLNADTRGGCFQSKHHIAFNYVMREKIASANIFGDSWKSFLAFFAPYGTENSFFNRLKKSPSFKHLFVYDQRVLDLCADPALSAELGGVRLDVAHVDATVSNTSLVCALVLSIPTLIVGVMGNNKEGWAELMHGLHDHADGGLCLPSAKYANLYSTFCLNQFDALYKRLFFLVILCFYSSFATLFLSVFYFMCRPSETCNCFSMIALVEAFKIEIREKRIQQSGWSRQPFGDGPLSPSGKNAHAQALSQHFEDMDVFWNAKCLAENKMQELKNHEFYMWYKSKSSANSIL